MNSNTFHRITLSTIILVGILLYAATIHYPQFLFDGALFIQNNPLLKDLDYYADLLNIKKFSMLDEQLGLDSDVTTNFMMRPVAYFTFSLNYLFGGFNPAPYRAVNIAVHILNALLVYACIEQFLRFWRSEKSLSEFSTRFIPTASAFVFLVHPLHTESVTYICQRFASLGALFYLATLWLYLVACWRQQQGINHACIKWASVAALFLGMLTRESLFTAPFMIVLLELTVLDNRLGAALCRAKAHIMLLPIIPLMILMVSAAQNNSSLSFSGALNVVNYEKTPVFHYALTQLVVVVKYVGLLFFPYGQNVDHDQMLYTLPYQWPVIFSGMMIVTMVGSAFSLYIKRRDDIRSVLIFVGVCWYFLALAVTSTVIPLPDLMVEHRTYLPSVGLIFALICLLDFARSSSGFTGSRNFLVAVVAIWCVILIAMTYNRNKLWESGVKLWSDVVRKSPAKHRAWYNLGVAHVKARNYPESVTYLQKSIALDPEWAQAYEVLGVALLELKRYQDSIDASKRGIEVDPANPVFYNNLGIAFAETEREEDARQAFLTAIALRPGYASAAINLDQVESYLESSIGRRNK